MPFLGWILGRHERNTIGLSLSNLLSINSGSGDSERRGMNHVSPLLKSFEKLAVIALEKEG